MQFMFWSCLLFLVYVFIGYPLMLRELTLLVKKSVYKRYDHPSVTIIVAVRNEFHRIDRRLQNLLELDYPKDKLQIIVSLDGPTDGTETLVHRYAEVEIVHCRW